jgi:hypothetical protein
MRAKNLPVSGNENFISVQVEKNRTLKTNNIAKENRLSCTTSKLSMCKVDA